MIFIYEDLLRQQQMFIAEFEEKDWIKEERGDL